MNEADTDTPRGGDASRAERNVAANTLRGRRIIVVLETLELGGAERQAIRLAERLLRHYAANVEVWGFADEGRAARACESAGIPWRLVPPHWGEYRTRQWLNAAARFAYLLRKAKTEILLPYCARANIICGLSWRLAGAKTCVWNQRDEGIGMRPESLAARWAVHAVSAYVANSRNTAEYLVRAFGVPLKCVSIVHNGVELPEPVRDRAVWRQTLQLTQNTFVGCMLANIHQNKDHDTLLRAWRIVVDNLPPRWDQAVLLLAGWLHPEADNIRTLTRELNLGDSVRFLGAVDDVAGLLSASDLGVFSSRSEGCPNGLLECMASGLPVVGTDIPGIREAVGPAGLEHLAPPDDARTFARRVLFLAHHVDSAASVGRAHRDRVLSEFSSSNMVEEMVGVMTRALNRTRYSAVKRTNGHPRH
jgi:glycosyltransferase involved in cell wall biosynthesis